MRLTEVADDKVVARTENCLKEKMPIIFAQRAIALSRALRHSVKGEPRSLARKIAVVHAKQANDARGDGAHRFQGAEGDSTIEETAAAVIRLLTERRSREAPPVVGPNPI